MVLEWIRRNDERFSSELKDYLFTTKSLDHGRARSLAGLTSFGARNLPS